MINTNKQGFTLVELSIVIIIIGFLIAGIAGGQSLIKSATLTSAITEIQSIQLATRTFTSIYEQLPGDMTNATAYFGTTDKNGNTVHNGNGDGYIGINAQPGSTESLAAFQQLALAGLIPGTYNGVADLVNGDPWGLVPGQNVPPSKLGTRYSFYASDFWGDYSQPINSIFVPKPVTVLDASFMDNKIDDAKPLTGSMLSTPNTCSSTNDCVLVGICSGNVDKTTPYNLEGVGNQCQVNFSIIGTSDYH